ncbi:hypothetical protein, variant 2 [Verruconis gallopava]|uniref:Protein kinase domain-containing protein n=1 Tax=Verruconis gallopava TaxID=253628 RepID=A0A0D1X9C7_9PEZI|nr:uncharacterized protein PV09_09485 [Verruconis gallopava]XP_016208626.1 hypothetical protein, variant 1 [Verruconis gallopava]XP_016208627.1 hypothetical protein, variant 2 [Verruconis gallopava]KIV98755.1 hypothetical protein PV09_09485 [Verruconis gallopava]KIV98756.1 hypothetical protein, variant 1 [Verruconis gallopava]KIV98757.1 hypothetical protein, variant 2 [Verruconis gallopava]
MDVDRLIFERLGWHANIVKCFGAINNGLILERGQSIRIIIKERGAYQISLDTKIRWLQQAAEGMKHMHHNDVLHANVGCHNGITVDGRLKIIDLRVVALMEERQEHVMSGSVTRNQHQQ